MAKALTVIGAMLALLALVLGELLPPVVLVVGLFGSGLGLVWWLTEVSLSIERPSKAPGPRGSADHAATEGVVPGAIRAGDPSVPPPTGN